jgi:lipopolysaccharide transport system permease protein
MQVREVVERRELLWNLTLRELRGRYKRTALGFGWSLLNPIATMVIFTFVFSFILKITPDPGDPSGLDLFAVWLLCGLLPWNFFATSTATSMGAVVGGANLVKKVWFPREHLVIASVGGLLITFLIELGLLAVVLLVVGNMVLPWLPVVMLLVALLAAFATGIGLVLGALNVYFRDLSHLWGIASMVWFYATPVVYPISLIEERNSDALSFVYGLNPMTRFVEAFRQVMYDLRMPTVGTWTVLVASAAISLLFGLWVFGRLSPRFAEEL